MTALPGDLGYGNPLEMEEVLSQKPRHRGNETRAGGVAGSEAAWASGESEAQVLTKGQPGPVPGEAGNVPHV